ncbi:MAG TPA: hypothetical protein PL106_15645, partial [Flavobacteriales bacterium]|nr:hypothetical protein [Flavobacteriales bacterium]
EAQRIMKRHFNVERIDLLNHTVFPFNQLLSGPSLALARRLSRRVENAAWLRWLSSDLLIRAVERA